MNKLQERISFVSNNLTFTNIKYFLLEFLPWLNIYKATDKEVLLYAKEYSDIVPDYFEYIAKLDYANEYEYYSDLKKFWLDVLELL